MSTSPTEKRIPRVIWILGLASLSMDLSSEMIHSLLPVFLVSVLGVGAGALGLIEGVAEATASIAKVFSGVWSDHLRRRKPLVVFGYGLAALVKPLFPLANSAAAVMGARFADRLGKGIRGAPRDALVADVTPPELRGAAYGLRQALDTLGALLGPLVAIGLMICWPETSASCSGSPCCPHGWRSRSWWRESTSRPSTPTIGRRAPSPTGATCVSSAARFGASS